MSTNIIKTLHERDWIRVVGHRDVPGRPAMYATTRQFLDYFNLKNLDQLPVLTEIRDLDTLTAELGFEPLVDKTIDDEGESDSTDAPEQETDEATDTLEPGADDVDTAADMTLTSAEVVPLKTAKAGSDTPRDA